MAHQYLEQLSDPVRAAVFGNVGTMVTFRVGATDAEELIKEFSPTFSEEDILNLPKYEMYLKLMIDGIASDPFSARGLPPFSDDSRTGNTEKVIRVSRERYTKPKEQIEEKIERWHSNEDEDEEKLGPKKNNPVKIQNNNNQNNPNKKEKDFSKFSAICSSCGKETETVFKPDGVRPVYCRECLANIRKGKDLEGQNRKKVKEEELKKVKEEESKKRVANNNSKDNSVLLRDNKEKEEEISLNDVNKVKPINFTNSSLNKN